MQYIQPCQNNQEAATVFYLCTMVNFYSYCGLIILVTIVKAKSIWKGVCRGNGVPQPGEFQQYAMVYLVLFYVAYIVFAGGEIDYILLAFLMIYTVTGKIEKLK